MRSHQRIKMRYHHRMRTTLEIDSDLLSLARHLAADRQQSMGRVVSDLMRRGLESTSQPRAKSKGIPVLARKEGARPVTSQEVRELLEQEG